MKIEAATRLRATLETHLMARATPITRVVEVGIKEIARQMMLRDYQVRTEQSKAYYVTKFIQYKDGAEPRVLEMVGWHGSGKYGFEKTIFEFYDETMKGHKPVVNLGAVTEENLTVPKQEKVIHDILEYIKKHC